MPRSSSGSHQSPALEPEYCPKHAHCWQQKAQNDERDRATQRVDHPVEIHTEEPGQEGDWQENQRYNGQAIDLLSLPLRDCRRVVLHDFRSPPSAHLQTLFNVFHLISIVIQFSGSPLINVWERLHTNNGRSDSTTIAVDV